MDLIQCKTAPDNHILSYISFIRKFDRSLSVGEMKQKIENGLFAIEFDLEYFDVLED